MIKNKITWLYKNSYNVNNCENTLWIMITMVNNLVNHIIFLF